MNRLCGNFKVIELWLFHLFFDLGSFWDRS